MKDLKARLECMRDTEARLEKGRVVLCGIGEDPCSAYYKRGANAFIGMVVELASELRATIEGEGYDPDCSPALSNLKAKLGGE